MRIDAHIHYADEDPAFLSLLEEFDLKLHNICVAHDTMGAWRNQAALYHECTVNHPDRFAWCTTFDLPDFTSDWTDRVLRQLDADFEAGAVACKIWKNIGMEVRKPDGSFLMPDDPILDPVYEHVAASGHTFLAHIAEPYACWQPLEPENPHYGYYSRNPQWHMYNRPEFPSHSTLVAARDQIAAKHPNLRLVGAHLGSLEYDVDILAERLDRYPNFAVDISARMMDLVVQPAHKVRAFFERFADRILFGTDVVMRQRPSQMPEGDRVAAIDSLRDTYLTHFAYFENKGAVTVRDRTTEGLNLPASILDSFYRDNAERWYPGI